MQQGGGSERENGPRLTTKEVCALGRFSSSTLWRRVRNGEFPPPIDQGREAIFDREQVQNALSPGRRRPPQRTSGKAWNVKSTDLKQAFARKFKPTEKELR